MKKSLLSIVSVFVLILISCGPSKEEIAKQQKAHDDSLVNAALQQKENQTDSIYLIKINELQSLIEIAENELTNLKNDPEFLYEKTRLETVRARVSTGGSYGWIDKDGKFWDGKDATKAFDNAVINEKLQLKKIESKNAEIVSLKEKLKEFQDLLNQ